MDDQIRAVKTNTVAVSDATFKKLIGWNLVMGALHLVQGVIMLAIASDVRLPVTTGHLSFNPVTEQLVSAQRHLFDLPLAWLVVAFVFLSAAAHFAIATVFRKRYRRDLQNGMNRFRWIEYSVSASIMIVAIAMLSGVYDLGTLIALFALTSGMNLMGLIMESRSGRSGKAGWLAYWIGCGLGIIPWVVIALYFWAAANFSGGEGVPGFVYGIFVSIFIAFNSFALNMWLQYKRVGKWHDYIFGERMFVVLSLVAKAGLAWQVFVGTLRP